LSISNNSPQAAVSLTGQELKLHGSLVYSTVSGLLAMSHELLQKAIPDSITINLSEVDKIDSAGVALLVEWQRYCQQQQKTCHFFGLNEQAVSLIETYKLNDILQTAE